RASDASIAAAAAGRGHRRRARGPRRRGPATATSSGSAAGGPWRRARGAASMTGGGSNGAPNSMDQYLDGRMAGPERERFESRMAADPALRAEAETQASIDASLKRMFIPPAAPAIGGRHRALRRPWHTQLPRLRWIAAAAVLLMALAVWG